MSLEHVSSQENVHRDITTSWQVRPDSPGWQHRRKEKSPQTSARGDSSGCLNLDTPKCHCTDGREGSTGSEPSNHVSKGNLAEPPPMQGIAHHPGSAWHTQEKDVQMERKILSITSLQSQLQRIRRQREEKRQKEEEQICAADGTVWRHELTIREWDASMCVFDPSLCAESGRNDKVWYRCYARRLDRAWEWWGDTSQSDWLRSMRDPSALRSFLAHTSRALSFTWRKTVPVSLSMLWVTRNKKTESIPILLRKSNLFFSWVPKQIKEIFFPRSWTFY